LAEREIWTHPEKGEIVRETLFTTGAYLVVTEDDDPPEFEREAVPGGDGAEDSVDLNFCGYETQLIGLEGGVKLLIGWPDDMDDDERQAMLRAWDEGMNDAWEDKGWELNDTEVWFWDDLHIEMLETTEEQGQAIDKAEVDWFSVGTPPPRPGTYSIETVEKVVWPNLPITTANWNGKQWVDEGGESINVGRWKTS